MTPAPLASAAPRHPPRRTWRRSAVVTALAAGLALTLAWAALTSGDVAVPARDVLAVLLGRGDAGARFVVLDLRLPRIVTALLAGAALGAAGALTQRLTRNALGSPDMLGLAPGASLGAAAVLLLAAGGPTATAAGACAGCLAAAATVAAFGGRDGLASGRLVLAGIGVAAFCQAAIGYLLTRARTQDAGTAQRWLVGSVAGADWSRIAPLAVVVALGVPLACLGARRLALLDFGDDLARGLGLPLGPTRAGLLAVAVALVAAATAVTGPLLFVALLAPQVAARLAGLGAPGPASSAAFGAALVVAADLLAQRLFTLLGAADAGAALPVGVVTAALGGGYLAVLLARRPEVSR